MFGPFGQYPSSRILRIIYYLPNFARLSWRLFRDPRIPIYKKAIPFIAGVISIAYLLFPFDVLPDPFAILGQLDDATVCLLIMVPSIWFFIRSCPKDLVREHAHQISRSSPL